MIEWYIAIITLMIAGASEWLHFRRIVRSRRLIFPRGAMMSLIAYVLPWIKVFALAAFAWGCVLLVLIEPQPQQAIDGTERKIDPAALKRIVILMDVSPSMWLADAQNGKTSRLLRASEVLSDIILRVPFDKARVSVVAFYTDVKPVVIDAVDPDLIQHLLAEMSLMFVFEDGSTDLLKGIQGAFDLAKDWRPGSTTFIVVTDGDSISKRDMPLKPPAIEQILVVGTGDSASGTFIDGHYSRQESGVLSDIAARLNGSYYNVDTSVLPNQAIKNITGELPMRQDNSINLQIAALIAIAVSSLFFLIASPALACFGLYRRKKNSNYIVSISNEPVQKEQEVTYA